MGNSFSEAFRNHREIWKAQEEQAEFQGPLEKLSVHDDPRSPSDNVNRSPVIVPYPESSNERRVPCSSTTFGGVHSPPPHLMGRLRKRGFNRHDNRASPYHSKSRLSAFKRRAHSHEMLLLSSPHTMQPVKSIVKSPGPDPSRPKVSKKRVHWSPDTTSGRDAASTSYYKKTN